MHEITQNDWREFVSNPCFKQLESKVADMEVEAAIGCVQERFSQQYAQGYREGLFQVLDEARFNADRTVEPSPENLFVGGN